MVVIKKQTVEADKVKAVVQVWKNEGRDRKGADG